MVDREDKVWLVKSSQRIIGPFTQSEILRRLKSRELNLGDDASRPGRRWQTIQAHPDFREIMDEVRRHQVSDETEVSFTPGQLTQTLTDFSEAELTEELTDKMGNFTRTAEIIVHDLPEEKKADAGARGGARFQTAGGVAQNPALKQQADRTMRMLWIVTALALVAALVFVLQKRVGKETNRPATVEAMREEVPKILEIGDSQEALRILKSFYPEPLKSGEMGIYMAPLLITLENQTMLGKRILDKMLQAGIGEAKQEWTAMGIAELMDGQIAVAEEDFQKALTIDKDYVPAMINLAYVRFQQAQYSQAESAALQAIHVNPGEGEAQLLLAETAIYLNEKGNAQESIDKALSELNKYRARQLDYEPEAAFYTLYLDWLKHGHKLSDEKLKAFLDLDPQLTEDHRHNVFVYKGQTSWSVIGRLCDQLVEQNKDHPRATTLRAVCLSKEGRKLDGRTFIEKAKDQAPQDVLVHAWEYYILNESGSGDLASVALASSVNLNRKGQYELPLILQARFSQTSGDNEAARSNWQVLYERNDRSISAIGGLAMLYASQGSFSEAVNYIQKGLKVSPDYIPLLKLQWKGQKEGWYGKG